MTTESFCKTYKLISLFFHFSFTFFLKMVLLNTLILFKVNIFVAY